MKRSVFTNSNLSNLIHYHLPSVPGAIMRARRAPTHRQVRMSGYHVPPGVASGASSNSDKCVPGYQIKCISEISFCYHYHTFQHKVDTLPGEPEAYFFPMNQSIYNTLDDTTLEKINGLISLAYNNPVQSLPISQNFYLCVGLV